jgi:hypothetical protein
MHKAAREIVKMKEYKEFGGKNLRRLMISRSKKLGR